MRRIPTRTSRTAFAVALIVTCLPRAGGAQVQVEPTPTRAVVSPWAVTDAPPNTHVMVLVAASEDQVQAEWPETMPATADDGWTAVRIANDQGDTVPASVTVAASRAGTRVDLVPEGPLAAGAAYTVRVASATRLPTSLPEQPIPVVRRTETRFTVGEKNDEAPPSWPSVGSATLTTTMVGPDFDACERYQERLSLTVGDATDDATPKGALRIHLAPFGARDEVPPGSVLVLTGSNVGSYEITSCDGRLTPWGPTAPATSHRVMQVWAEDLTGKTSDSLTVLFERPDAESPTWTTRGRVLAEGEVLPSESETTVPSAPEAASDDTEPAAGQGTGGSNPLVLLAALAALVVIAVVVGRKNRS